MEGALVEEALFVKGYNALGHFKEANHERGL